MAQSSKRQAFGRGSGAYRIENPSEAVFPWRYGYYTDTAGGLSDEVTEKYAGTYRRADRGSVQAALRQSLMGETVSEDPSPSAYGSETSSPNDAPED